MTLSRWQQIRSVIKLNDNDRSPKMGSPLYNPCYKYDLVYKAQVKNLNFVTLRAQKDQTGNEMTWKFMGYGERGTGVVSRIIGKPGVTRGGQIAFVTDASQCRHWAYVHRHKVHACPAGLQTGTQ